MGKDEKWGFTLVVSGLRPGLTLAQGFLEGQREGEDELDEEGEIGGCWGGKGVGEFGECVG